MQATKTGRYEAEPVARWLGEIGVQASVFRYPLNVRYPVPLNALRDILRLYDQRLQLMLTQQGPQFPNWDQDATAVADRYSEQDPAAVAAGLAEAAEVIAARFGAVVAGQWQRTGSRSDGAHFTVESYARYFIHDPVHHLYDVTGARYIGPAEPGT